MSDGGDRRLHRCIRDLAALNALPSICIGRTPDQVVDLMMDALPTALAAELVLLRLPGPPPRERAVLRGQPPSEPILAALRAPVDDGPVALPGGGDLWRLEAEVPLAAGTGQLVVGRAAPLDPETDRVLVRSAANLVGATLESARVLEIASRKDDFLAMLGHELRNPLGPILTAVELLARHPEAAREQSIIERHTRHLARLVDDLLDISRVTRGHVELRREQMPLAVALGRAVEIANPLIIRQRHTLRVAEAGDVTLLGDPVRLAQVFSNLLTNAAKFTPPGGKIDVEVDRRDDRVRVTVRDDGRGIEREQVRRIFEPFVQLDGDRDPLRGGLGLGLAIVKNLVERHSGAITVASEGRGRGAAFTVELPTVARVEPAVAEVRRPPVRGRDGVRILVVDDNVDLAELISEALKGLGFLTAVEHAGGAANPRGRSCAPHAAVRDVGLPEIDGYELARILRAEHGPKPTLIAATGYGQEKDRVLAADAGFDHHLTKPVSVREIVQVLDQCVVEAAAGPA